MEFSNLSITLTKNLDNKKKQGIYFSPYSYIEQLLKEIPKDLEIQNVLEPSCGSCQFIDIFGKHYQSKNITAIEYNETIFNSIKNSKYLNKIQFINQDFLTFKSDIKYDLIIGNPPYFVVKKADIPKEYREYVIGRPNIYVIFILHCLSMIEENGVLAFIIPNNFDNCMYYNKVREYINNNFTILNLIQFDSKFMDTQIETYGLVIQNKEGDNSKFCKYFNGNCIFNKNIEHLNKLLQHSTTIKDLDCNVSVGKVVWNQVKEKLTDDNTKTLLIYSSDIVDKQIKPKKYSNESKKNYINIEGNTNITLVVNRGYGKGKYKFSYCIVDIDKPYVIENHLICINTNETLSKEKTMKIYNKIIHSFEDERTSEFISYYFRNNGINTMELERILPVYLNI